MSENEENIVSSPSLSPEEDAAKTHALIPYCLMVLGILTGVFWIIGAIWAMVKKGDAQGTIFEDHYSNIIKTFWLSLAFSLLGFILAFVGIGTIILIAVWVWAIYRVIKGLVKITSNKSYYS